MTTIRRSTLAAGGRWRARRLLLAAAIVLAASGRLRGEDVNGGPHVAVREEKGVYHVSARFVVPQPAATVLTVLTDYEQIPRFMPDVKTSIVRERAADRVLVEQEAVARMMMFSKRIYLLLDVQMQDGLVRFKDASGRSFTRYEGAWRLDPEAGGTRVAYELRARPSFDVPEFLLTRLLRRDARHMIERLRREIASR